MTLQELPRPIILAAEISKETKGKVDMACKETIDNLQKYKFTLPEKAFFLKILVEGFNDAIIRYDKMNVEK